MLWKSSQPETLTMSTIATPDDARYQEHILQGVSRTFALTIPQLPPTLRAVIGNAYLLCRIVDTVEDDSALTLEQTHQLAGMFTEVVSGSADAEIFAQTLYPLLSEHTIPAEHDLIKNTSAVIRMTHSFNTVQRRALERCIHIMSQEWQPIRKKNPYPGSKIWLPWIFTAITSLAWLEKC